jgi:hypothetical protein
MQFDQLRRRAFITLLGGVAAAWPLAARAQQAGKPVITILGSGAADAVPSIAQMRLLDADPLGGQRLQPLSRSRSRVAGAPSQRCRRLYHSCSEGTDHDGADVWTRKMKRGHFPRGFCQRSSQPAVRRLRCASPSMDFMSTIQKRER